MSNGKVKVSLEERVENIYYKYMEKGFVSHVMFAKEIKPGELDKLMDNNYEIFHNTNYSEDFIQRFILLSEKSRKSRRTKFFKDLEVNTLLNIMFDLSDFEKIEIDEKVDIFYKIEMIKELRNKKGILPLKEKIDAHKFCEVLTKFCDINRGPIEVKKNNVNKLHEIYGSELMKDEYITQKLKLLISAQGLKEKYFDEFHNSVKELKNAEYKKICNAALNKEGASIKGLVNETANRIIMPYRKDEKNKKLFIDALRHFSFYLYDYEVKLIIREQIMKYEDMSEENFKKEILESAYYYNSNGPTTFHFEEDFRKLSESLPESEQDYNKLLTDCINLYSALEFDCGDYESKLGSIIYLKYYELLREKRERIIFEPLIEKLSDPLFLNSKINFYYLKENLGTSSILDFYKYAKKSDKPLPKSIMKLLKEYKRLANKFDFTQSSVYSYLSVKGYDNRTIDGIVEHLKLINGEKDLKVAEGFLEAERLRLTKNTETNIRIKKG